MRRHPSSWTNPGNWCHNRAAGIPPAISYLRKHPEGDKPGTSCSGREPMSKRSRPCLPLPESCEDDLRAPTDRDDIPQAPLTRRWQDRRVWELFSSEDRLYAVDRYRNLSKTSVLSDSDTRRFRRSNPAAHLPIPRFEAHGGVPDAQRRSPPRQGCKDC